MTSPDIPTTTLAEKWDNSVDSHKAAGATGGPWRGVAVDMYHEAEDLERRLAAATARAERFEYCEECNFPLSDCGELNPDGTPSVDCRVCQLVSKLTDLSTEVDRLRKEREWQPIETAPKDGSRVLVTGSFRDVGEASYSNSLKCWYWRAEDKIVKPTHWMPLPAAPKQEEGV